jgi:hypothetical protein
MASIVVSVAATRTASVHQNVRCERCGKAYAYEIIRSASGSGSSLFGLDNAGARAAAEAEAAALREAALGRDPVPCPHCRHVQDAAIDDVRRRRVRRARSAVLHTAWISAGVAGGIAYAHWKRHGLPEGGDGRVLAVAGAAGAAVALFGLAYWWAGRLKFDRAQFDFLPPDHWRRWAQPALLERRDDRGPYYAPANRVELIRHSDGVVVQPFRIGLPANCAHCCAPAGRAYVPPVGLSKGAETYPCCQPCQRVARGRWWRAALAVVLGCGLALAALAGPARALLPDGTPEWVRVALLAGMGVPVTAILAILVANVADRPVSRRTLDRTRGWVRLRARNPAYQKLIEARFTDPFVHSVRVAPAPQEQAITGGV